MTNECYCPRVVLLRRQSALQRSAFANAANRNRDFRSFHTNLTEFTMFHNSRFLARYHLRDTLFQRGPEKNKDMLIEINKRINIQKINT